MNLTSKIAATTALVLGVTTLIINPRLVLNDDSTTVMSCTTQQLLIIDRSQAPSDEFVIPTGLYTTEQLIQLLYTEIENNIETELAGNLFAGLATTLFENLKPRIKKAMDDAVDSVCAFKPASFSFSDLTQSQ